MTAPDLTFRKWDQLEIKVRVTKMATLRLRLGILLIKLAALVIGCGIEVERNEVPR